MALAWPVPTPAFPWVRFSATPWGDPHLEAPSGGGTTQNEEVAALSQETEGLSSAGLESYYLIECSVASLRMLSCHKRACK